MIKNKAKRDNTREARARAEVQARSPPTNMTRAKSDRRRTRKTGATVGQRETTVTRTRITIDA